MVLATVYETVGSTYTKAGHRMLIAGNADYRGLVSGGCLEGDLADRARGVLERDEPQAVTYDMRDEADDLWGLGVGCNGLIRVFLQPLTASGEYEPFASIARRLLSGSRASTATIIASQSNELPAGATLVWDGETRGGSPLEPRASDRLIPGCNAARKRSRPFLETRADGLAVLYAPLAPVPRLLVLGAGLDAVPVVNMAAELGWLVTLADHRPAYLEKADFTAADGALLIDPPTLSRELELGEFDAVIVMSHHFVTDQTYLAQLASVDLDYVGVLGPRARRERLLSALEDAGALLAPRLRGPVGIDIGADTPESIALSLLAEIHATLAEVSGHR